MFGIYHRERVDTHAGCLAHLFSFALFCDIL